MQHVRVPEHTPLTGIARGNKVGFSENDIRPRHLDEGKFAAMREDIDWLRARKASFIPVDCPACGSTEHSPAFEKYSFSFARCASCRTVFMTPRAPEPLLGEFYARSALYEYWNEHIFPASRDVRMEKIFRPRVADILELCNRHGFGTGLLVDAGAASGMFCEEALKSGRFGRVVGVEPGRAQAAACRERGIEVMELPLEKISRLAKPADIVTSFETIEHVFAPRDFVRSCRNLLAPGGLLVLTCPNIEGFDILTLGTDSDSLDAEHINLFTPDSLCRMLEAEGFAIVRRATPGELDTDIVHARVRDGKLDLSAQPFLQKLFQTEENAPRRAFQEFLKTAGLSSHLHVAARKLP